MGDQRDQGERREELAAVVCLLVGELGQEVFVDAAEDVAGDTLQLVRVEETQQPAEHVVAQVLILGLGQGAAQAGVVGLDGLHGRNDGLGPVCGVGQGNELVELRRGPQEDGASLGEIFLGERPLLAAADGQTVHDVIPDREKAAVGVAEEHQPHHRQEVFVAGVVGVGTERVRGFPEAAFYGFEVFDLGHPGTLHSLYSPQ